MHDGGAGLGEPRALALREVDAVREQAAAAQQAEAVVDIGVVLRPGKQPPHERALALALGEVAVYVAVGVPRGERAGPAELRLGGGHREPHGDRVAQPAAAVPALDQRLAVAYAGVRIVAQRLRGVAIHHRLAADDGDAPALRRREQDLGGGPVHGGEDHRGGGAVLRETVEEGIGRYARVRRRGVAALLREGEAVQPVQQVPARRGQHPMLRKVDVGVDEARQHQRLAVVVGREDAEPLRQPGRVAAPDDAPVPGDRDRPAAMEPDRALRPDHGGIVAEGQHRAADHPSVMPCTHGVTRSRWPIPLADPAGCWSSGWRSRMRRAHGATRSSMRNRRMRSTFARAAARSVSASLPIRASNAARIASFVAPFTAKMNGKPKRLR